MASLHIGDLHCPYQDDRAVDIVCQVAQDLRPDEVVDHSDGVDFYQLSPFSKDPARQDELQDDLDVAYAVRKTLTTAIPGARWILLAGGNHEDRLARYLASQAQELHGLRALELTGLLRLDDLGWEMGPAEQEYLAGRLVAIHGERYSKHAGWGAKKELELRFFQQSVMMGHTHKIGSYTATGPRHTVGGWEIGCLCQCHYNKHPNWQLGFAVLTTSEQPRTHTFAVEQVQIVGSGNIRRAIFRGKEYVAK